MIFSNAKLLIMLGNWKQLIGRIPLVDYIHTVYVLPQKDLVLPPYPVFQCNDASDEFYKLLKTCNFYVEYGSGGSTLAAAKLNKRAQSYESSRQFWERFNEQMQDSATIENKKLEYFLFNYGPTRSWGIPFPAISNRYAFRKKMRKYSDPHWVKTGAIPDLILVDGRFRVCCALKNLAALQGNRFKLVVDDYAERTEYHVIEDYSYLTKLIGTTAFFEGTKKIDGIQNDIRKHELDYR